MTAPVTPSIIEFTTSPSWLGLSLSPAQETLLRAIYGLPLDEEHLSLWGRCTGRVEYSGRGFSEVTVVAGARSGKDSRIATAVVLFEVAFGGHEAQLAKGERAVVPLVAQDGAVAGIAFGYIKGAATESPLLRDLIEPKGERERELRFRNGIDVVSFACSAKSVRGWSIPAAIMDEVAFYRLEGGTNADREMQRALRRGMVSFKSTRRLVKISTPGARSGVLWEDHERYWAKDSPDVLVWHAPTTLMNPTITEEDLAEERRKDPLSARREYDAEFIGDDATAYLAQPWIEAARVDGCFERPPAKELSYRAGVDPSGGGADEFALAIVHVEDGRRIVQDVSRGWRGSRAGKVELTGVVADIATILRRYGIGTVTGDHFGGAWVAQEFAKHGISYVPSELNKAKCYRELKPFLAEGRIAILDDGVLVGQLGALQESWARGGRVPIVDHPRGGHDDRPNALAVVVAELAKSLAPAVAMTDDQVRAALGGDEPTGGAPTAAVDRGFHGRIPENLAAARSARELRGMAHATPAFAEPGRRAARFWR